MAPVRGRTILLGAAAVLGLALAAAVRLGRREEPSGGANGRPGTSEVEWVRTQPPGWDLVIYVPREWAERNQAEAGGAEWHFAGPGEPGRRPELIFGWKRSSLGPSAWWDSKIPTPEDRRRGLELLAQGQGQVAGIPARWCVVRSTARLEDGTRLDRIELSYWIAGRGHVGHVRGIAPAEDFPRLRPLFEEAAARVRYAR